MPRLTEFEDLPPPPLTQTMLTVPDSTIRQTLRVTTSSDQIRVRLSNAFGLYNLLIIIAVPRAGMGKDVAGASGIHHQRSQTLTISGNESITIVNV